MNEPHFLKLRFDAASPPTSPESAPAQAAIVARASFLAARRNELLAPVHAIVEVSTRMLDDLGESDAVDFVADAGRIRSAGLELLALIKQRLDPEGLDVSVSTDGFDQMCSQARHEMLNKLNPIVNYSEMWLEDDEHFVEAYAQDLQLIQTAAQRCRSLTEDILTFSTSTASGADGDPLAGTIAQILGRVLIPPRQRFERRLCGRLLVADDTETNRDILRRRLETRGHQVEVAVDGRQALEMLRSGPFDLVLLDMVMPHMSGIEVLAAIKQDPALRDLPVIMISALENMEIVASCIQLGADDYLPKPFDPTVLQARIEAGLERSQLRRREKEHLTEIQRQRQRADDLLHVILPKQIVGELKSTNAVVPRRYDNIAVLFADIVDFTPYCEQYPPVEVLQSLQSLVEQWENIALKYQVHKIKTIGDAFMAACGMFDPTDNPALNCVRAGLEMIDATRGLSIGWNLRVGIDYGSAVGGILGSRQFLFDLWGDTVNTAARMESHGVQGAVVLSADAWQHVAPHCQGRSLGKRTIKGKGAMELYCIEAPSPALA